MLTFKQAAKYGAVLATVVGVSAANAAIDLTPITSQFTSSDVITSVLAVAGTVAAIYVALMAARTVLRMIRGA